MCLYVLLDSGLSISSCDSITVCCQQLYASILCSPVVSFCTTAVPILTTPRATSLHLQPLSAQVRLSNTQMFQYHFKLIYSYETVIYLIRFLIKFNQSHLDAAMQLLYNFQITLKCKRLSHSLPIPGTAVLPELIDNEAGFTRKLLYGNTKNCRTELI